MPRKPKQVIRHLDNGARPACGAPARGALVVDVDHMNYVTCEHCFMLTTRGLFGGSVQIERGN